MYWGKWQWTSTTIQSQINQNNHLVLQDPKSIVKVVVYVEHQTKILVVQIKNVVDTTKQYILIDKPTNVYDEQIQSL